MEGILIVDKPAGWTSFDVVAKIRNLSKVKKVGHSGTLDPMATGLLPIFLGKATKSIQFFLDADKAYVGEMTLGIKTDSADATGEIIHQQEYVLDEPRLQAVLQKYQGEILQKPPMHSAVKVKGQRLYKLARQGLEIERPARPIYIYSLQIKTIEKEIPPKVSFYVHCSKGTYVRQLAADTGDDLGCGAHLSALRRIYAYPFHISQALTMSAIITLAQIGQLERYVQPVEVFIHGQASS